MTTPFGASEADELYAWIEGLTGSEALGQAAHLSNALAKMSTGGLVKIAPFALPLLAAVITVAATDGRYDPTPPQPGECLCVALGRVMGIDDGAHP